MKLHFIDVGQGDCILIESPDGKRMLVDTGEEEYADDVVDYLKSQHISNLEFLALTHPHSDHIGSVPEILQHFNVAYVLDNGYPHGSRTQERALQEINNKKIPYLVAYAGQQYRLGKKIRVEVLSPPRKLFKNTSSDTNNNSLVMRITFGNVSALLTGDIENEAESALLESRINIESNILKVAHHGSRDSTSIELLRQVRPEYVVISVGKNNEFGHPHKAILRRLSPDKLGSKVFRTDRFGTITLKTDGKTTVAEVAK